MFSKEKKIHYFKKFTLIHEQAENYKLLIIGTFNNILYVLGPIF